MARCGSKSGPFGPYLFLKEENVKKINKAVNAVARAEWAVSKAMNRLAKFAIVPKNKKAISKAATKALMSVSKLRAALNELVVECSRPD